MRPLLVLALCSPGLARADDRLDLDPLPELRILGGFTGYEQTLALGAGRRDDARGVAAVWTMSAGKVTRSSIGGMDGQIDTVGASLEHVHSHLLFERRAIRDHERSSSIAFEVVEDYGKPRGLAPVRLGRSRHLDLDATTRALLQLGPEVDDFIMGATVEGTVGGTVWWDAPGLDGVFRRGIALGLVRAPTDGELPRGTVDLLRGRVEHATIRRTAPASAAAGGTPPRPPETEVRTVELGLGPRELTFWIDNDLIAVLTDDIGWTWLEADTDRGTIADNMFHMRFGGSLQTRRQRALGERRVGLALAREPTYSPDGQRLVSEWRVALDTALDDRRFMASASGGISWLTPTAGDSPQDRQLVRYGTHLEGFLKLCHGIAVGGYHAMTFEPSLAANPWASPRRWSSESGVLVRFATR